MTMRGIHNSRVMGLNPAEWSGKAKAIGVLVFIIVVMVIAFIIIGVTQGRSDELEWIVKDMTFGERKYILKLRNPMECAKSTEKPKYNDGENGACTRNRGRNYAPTGWAYIDNDTWGRGWFPPPEDLESVTVVTS